MTDTSRLGTCIGCCLDIPDGASKCYHCGSYQEWWRNWLPAFGTAAALLTFAGSTVAVVLAAGTDFWERKLSRPSVDVIAYSSPNATVLNTGNVDVLIERISERSAALNYEAVLPVMETVGRGSVRTRGASVDSGAGDEIRGVAVANVTDEEWEMFKSGAVAGSSPHLFSADAPELVAMKRQTGPKLRTFPGDCRISFRSLAPDSSSEEKKFECVGIILRRP